MSAVPLAPHLGLDVELRPSVIIANEAGIEDGVAL